MLEIFQCVVYSMITLIFRPFQQIIRDRSLLMLRGGMGSGGISLYLFFAVPPPHTPLWKTRPPPYNFNFSTPSPADSHTNTHSPTLNWYTGGYEQHLNCIEVKRYVKHLEVPIVGASWTCHQSDLIMWLSKHEHFGKSWGCVYNYMSLVTWKSVLSVCDQSRLKPACSATETR